MPDRTIGDNFGVRVVADTKEQFLMGIYLAFNGQTASHFTISPYWGMIFFWYLDESEKKAREHSHWLPSRFDVDPEASGKYVPDFRYKRVIPTPLTESYKIIGLPGGKASAVSCAKRAWKWMSNAKYTIPDTWRDQDADKDDPMYNPHNYHDSGGDVSNHKGYEISTGDLWNHVGCHHGAICHIRPHFIWCGK